MYPTTNHVLKMKLNSMDDCTANNVANIFEQRVQDAPLSHEANG